MHPFTTITALLPHQGVAADKLMPTRVGALFMEMGTGKTRTAVELIARRQRRIDRVVWFCPVGLIPTIADEWRRHTDLPASEVHAFSERTRAATLPRTSVYLRALYQDFVDRVVG